jgi:hypothetical protein
VTKCKVLTYIDTSKYMGKWQGDTTGKMWGDWSQDGNRIRVRVSTYQHVPQTHPLNSHYGAIIKSRGGGNERMTWQYILPYQVQDDEPSWSPVDTTVQTVVSKERIGDCCTR